MVEVFIRAVKQYYPEEKWSLWRYDVICKVAPIVMLDYGYTVVPQLKKAFATGDWDWLMINHNTSAE